MPKWICALQSAESLLNPCVTSALICDVTKGTSRTRWMSESRPDSTHTNTNFSMTSLGFSTSWRLSLTRALAATFTFICTFILKTLKNVTVPCLMHKSIHRSSPAVRVISNKHPGIIFDCDSQIFLKLINKQLSDNRNDWMKWTALPVRHSVMYS